MARRALSRGTLLDWKSSRVESSRAEAMIEGRINTLVENGVLRPQDMKTSRITRERVFAQLRSEGITHLGRVRRLYLEATGDFAVVPEPDVRPGLCIVPDWDKAFVREQKVRPEFRVCANCGEDFSRNEHTQQCANCRGTRWVSAIE